MAYKVTIEYSDGFKEQRIFDEQNSCKCTTSKFVRDLVKSEQFTTLTIDKL